MSNPNTLPGKARILFVGEIVNGAPEGFVFDCYKTITGLEISDVPKWGGWTLAELREVIARPEEFLSASDERKP